MQYLLTAYDGTGDDVLKRRMDARVEHLERIAVLKKNGEFLFGGAILDMNGKMIGSVILFEFPDRETLDKRLEDEPYIRKSVWEKIDIVPFRLAKTD